MPGDLTEEDLTKEESTEEDLTEEDDNIEYTVIYSPIAYNYVSQRTINTDSYIKKILNKSLVKDTIDIIFEYLQSSSESLKLNAIFRIKGYTIFATVTKEDYDSMHTLFYCADMKWTDDIKSWDDYFDMEDTTDEKKILSFLENTGVFVETHDEETCSLYELDKFDKRCLIFPKDTWEKISNIKHIIIDIETDDILIENDIFDFVHNMVDNPHIYLSRRYLHKLNKNKIILYTPNDPETKDIYFDMTDLENKFNIAIQ